MSEPDDCTRCSRCLRKYHAPEPTVEALWDALMVGRSFMVLCATCGNKRCPHANDHRLACTASNEIDQPGSAYA